MTDRVVIIGAGAVGCLSALALAEQGREVMLIERGALGGEASWAGGGIMFPLLPWHYREPVNALALAGAARYPQLCRALYASTGIDPEYQACGMLVLQDYGGDAALQWCRAHGVAAQAEEGALWLPQVGQVRNPRLMQALRARLQALGVAIFEYCEMQPLQARSGRIFAWRAASGQVFEADAYVLACGAWSRTLLGEYALQLQHRPMRGQMLLYRADAGLLSRILYREDFYLIPRRDGHILAGSTVEDAGFDKSTTEDVRRALEAKARSLLPALTRYPVVRHWAGLRPGSPDNIPVIDRHPALENLYLNTGHFRYGVTMAPSSAEILLSRMGGKVQSAAHQAYAFPA